MIVLDGMGVGEIDSSSTIVAWGLGRDLDAGESVSDAAFGASIEELFVIDFDGTHRQPTRGEFRKYRRILKMMKVGQLHWKPLRGHKGIKVWPDRRPEVRKVA